jgi:hypothetical protein
MPVKDRLRRWESDQDIFAEYRLDEQIAKALERKVFLPSGGSLIIDRTEAMTVIDVNTRPFSPRSWPSVRTWEHFRLCWAIGSALLSLPIPTSGLSMGWKCSELGKRPVERSWRVSVGGGSASFRRRDRKYSTTTIERLTRFGGPIGRETRPFSASSP